MWLVVGMSLFSGVAMLPLWYKTAFQEQKEGSVGRVISKKKET